MRRPVIVALVALATAVGVATAMGLSGEPADASAPSRAIPDLPPYVFGTNPLGDAAGSEVSSLVEAALNVPFTPVQPQAINTRPQMFVTDSSVSPDWQMVVLNYPSSQFGTVQIFERALGLSQEAIDELTNLPPGVETSATVLQAVVLVGGQPAAVVGTPETTMAVHWRQNGFQIDVVGPFDTLSAADAVSIANDISSQG